MVARAVVAASFEPFGALGDGCSDAARLAAAQAIRRLRAGRSETQPACLAAAVTTDIALRKAERAALRRVVGRRTYRHGRYLGDVHIVAKGGNIRDLVHVYALAVSKCRDRRDVAEAELADRHRVIVADDIGGECIAPAALGDRDCVIISGDVDSQRIVLVMLIDRDRFIVAGNVDDAIWRRSRPVMARTVPITMAVILRPGWRHGPRQRKADQNR